MGRTETQVTTERDEEMEEKFDKHRRDATGGEQMMGRVSEERDER